jgi:hypothetical protein
MCELCKVLRFFAAIRSAGIGNPRRVLSSSGTVHSQKDFEFIMAVNVTGTFNVLRLAAAVRLPSCWLVYLMLFLQRWRC